MAKICDIADIRPVLCIRGFSDIRADLPGISANVLTQRLEGLEASGLIVRRRLPPPASAQVYELTQWGFEAEPIRVGSNDRGNTDVLRSCEIGAGDPQGAGGKQEGGGKRAAVHRCEHSPTGISGQGRVDPPGGGEPDDHTSLFVSDAVPEPLHSVTTRTDELTRRPPRRVRTIPTFVASTPRSCASRSARSSLSACRERVDPSSRLRRTSSSVWRTDR